MEVSLSGAWGWYKENQSALTPIGVVIGGLLVAFAALRQSRIAHRQAITAADRHRAQTDADRQRHITESFAKAIEQIAHDKIEVRLGGIYTLERISRESPDDYWTSMETLSAFLRERARWECEPESLGKMTPSVKGGPPDPPTDIAAVTALSR